MIINVLANGDIKNIKPENIYQSSNDANTIYLLAPFSANVNALINFELPQTHEIKGEFMFDAPTQISSELNMWTLKVNHALTEYYGDVKYQIRFVSNSQVIAVARGQFKVYEGVFTDLTEVPPEDVFVKILGNLTTIKADLLNGNLEARALKEYSEAYNYSLNSYVVSNQGGVGKIYYSKIENNKGNPLTDTNSWGEILLDGCDLAIRTQEDLSDYKLVVEGLFADAEENLDSKLLGINNTISSNKNVVDAELLKINNILKGKEQSLAYANYQEIVNAFNTAATNAYNVGQTIYVQSTKVPDLWVYSVENTHVDFAYVGDEEIIDTLSENGFVQFGYYKLAMMETKSTDVANAVTLDTAQTITGNKTFQGDVTCNYQLSYEKTNAQIQRGNITFKVQNQQTNKGATLYINNMTATLGGFDRNGNVRGVQYCTSDDTTNLIGTVKLNDKNIATTDMLQSVDAETISNLIQDSGSIAHTVINNKLKFELDSDITSQISKSLVTPMTRPTATQLVAVDNTNSQTMINIGDGLVLDGETLKATGGGGGGSSINVIDNLTSTSSTDALSAKQGNELYTQIRETKSQITETELASQKHILVKGDGVLDDTVYRFTINNPTKYNKYKTHLTRFLVDLHLPVVEALDSTKEVVITFGDTTYYVHNILKGMEHATIGDLKQVGKYDASGYRFTTEMTFFQISGAVGFAIIPTISMSDILSLDSDQMDNYVVDGGLLQGQLAVCRKVITNGYEEGALYRFDILYPNTYSWIQLSYSKSGIDNIIQSAIIDVLNTEV